MGARVAADPVEGAGLPVSGILFALGRGHVALEEGPKARRRDARPLK